MSESVTGRNDVSPSERRGRGRPPKADALTAAQRAKRYRERKKALKSSSPPDKARPTTVAELQKRLTDLQMKYDLEHMKVTNLEVRLNTMQTELTRPKTNPLSGQVKALQKRIAEQDRTIRNYSAEIIKLRDELSASR
jgi:uncharacterized coiled-coil protein SlyX